MSFPHRTPNNAFLALYLPLLLGTLSHVGAHPFHHGCCPVPQPPAVTNNSSSKFLVFYLHSFSQLTYPHAQKDASCC